MDRIAFSIAGRPVYWYGIMIAAAFLAAIGHWTLIARREDRKPGFASDLAFWIMLSAIVGSRVAYVIANYRESFAGNFWSVFRIDEGGLVFYGGFLACILTVLLLAYRNREPVWSLADFCVSALPLGHALGRVGCFLNSCCYGKVTQSLLGTTLTGERRHPTQLYEAGVNIVIYLALLAFYRRRKRDGTVLALYLLIYPPARFLIEFLRGDQRAEWFGLTVAQVVSIGLLLTGVALWFLLPKGRFRPWMPRKS